VARIGDTVANDDLAGKSETTVVARLLAQVAMSSNVGRGRHYISAVRWQFAKTMPQWPHEYTVRHWQPDLEAEFCMFADLIRSAGMVKPWPPEAASPRYRHTYLELDGWEYWTMGETTPETTVINRARLAGIMGSTGEASEPVRGRNGPTTIAPPTTSEVRDYVRDRL